MATQPINEQSFGRFVSVEEYLSTVYEPDCEYDDGAVVERNLGEFEHSYLQVLLGTLFTVNMENWDVFGLTEQRIQLTPNQFRVPDVCVVHVGAPVEDILTHPPLIAIEILSPEDTIRRAAKKAAEYSNFGVEHVWIIDPNARVAYRGTSGGLERVPTGELTVPETPIVVRIAELFEKLDQVRLRGRK